jgi:hypothetical protein
MTLASLMSDRKSWRSADKYRKAILSRSFRKRRANSGKDFAATYSMSAPDSACRIVGMYVALRRRASSSGGFPRWFRRVVRGFSSPATSSARSAAAIRRKIPKESVIVVRSP